MDEVLVTETVGAVRVLTLNRAPRLNALNGELLTALNAAFDEIAADQSVRAVLMTGAGRGFCAGADLGQQLAGTDLGALLGTYYNPLVRKMRNLSQPIIVAVNGVAAGAGMNLALAGDVVVAARSASFTQAFVHIGLVPDAGGTYFLPRLVGEARARAMMMLGETITAAQAEAYGLIWKLFDDADFAAQAHGVARTLAQLPTQSLAAIKQALNVSPANSLDGQLETEQELQTKLGKTADFLEGVAAFLEKRPAVFGAR